MTETHRQRDGAADEAWALDAHEVADLATEVIELSEAPPIVPAPPLSKSEVRTILLSLMLTMFLTALDRATVLTMYLYPRLMLQLRPRLFEQLKPGVRENDIVAEVNKFLYTHGSDDVEAINAISGERCNPHPHNFTDRMIRPGDQAFFDILQSFMGYRTCYYRTFNVGRATDSQRDAYKKAREWLDNAMARIKPGAKTSDICAAFLKCGEFGFPDEMSAFGLQFAHGLGLALHERPIISRVVSMDHPTEIKEGMVFAIETYCPATDGFSAARIEEEVVVTDKGCKVISLFPAEELPIANRY